MQANVVMVASIGYTKQTHSSFSAWQQEAKFHNDRYLLYAKFHNDRY